MKVFKRNAVIITVLLFVAVAVYLNWSYNRGQELSVDAKVTDATVTGDGSGEATQSLENAEPDADSGSLYYEEHSAGESTLDASVSDYFDTARLTRQQARDSATATLQEAAAIETASQEEIDSALNAITVMANYSIKEAQIESMLKAKDFEDCVVFISGDSVTVIVPAAQEGLGEAAVARITETVISELSVSADQIKITPVTA